MAKYVTFKCYVHHENRKIIAKVIDDMLHRVCETEQTLILYETIYKRFFKDVKKLVDLVSYEDILNWLQKKNWKRKS